MKFKKLSRKAISTVLIASLSVCTGCGDCSIQQETDIPLVNDLTVQEVMDNYAENLSYDSVTRNVKINKTEFNMKDVTDESKIELIKNAYATAESELGSMQYSDNYTISESEWVYIKSLLNTTKLDNPNIIQIKQDLGYYFVDVTYDVSSSELGTFKDSAELVGVNGAFIEDEYGNQSLDTVYLSLAQDTLNTYYRKNGIYKVANFNADTGKFEIIAGDPFQATTNQENGIYNATNDTADDEIIGETDETLEVNVDDLVDENTNTDEIETNLDETVSTDETTDFNNENAQVTDTFDIINNEDSTDETNSRECQLDIEEFATIVGISNKSIPFMPDINLVYNLPYASGTISGFGLCSEYNDGLKRLGVESSLIQGTATLRYVFKDLYNGELSVENIYLHDENIQSGVQSGNDIVVPEFLSEELNELINRYDCAVLDNLLRYLVDGTLYRDKGCGLLVGLRNNYVDTIFRQSTIRQFLYRDVTNNKYVVEIETTVEDGAKSVDQYGSYQDIYQVCIEQNEDSDFVITDMIRTSRETLTEPDIETDSLSAKRLYALGLANEVTDTQKENANELLNNLQIALNNRLFRGPLTDENGNVTVKYGLYDIFQDESELLSSTELEYDISEFKNESIKYGKQYTSEYKTQVVEWIGGADNQIEFTTEELFKYDELNKGLYLRVYYLISYMNDEWKIDERTVMDSQDLEANELNEYLSRF